jgi:hypothetical protein
VALIALAIAACGAIMFVWGIVRFTQWFARLRKSAAMVDCGEADAVEFHEAVLRQAHIGVMWGILVTMCGWTLYAGTISPDDYVLGATTLVLLLIFTAFVAWRSARGWRSIFGRRLARESVKLIDRAGPDGTGTRAV